MDDSDLTQLVCRLLAQRCGWAWKPEGINPAAPVWTFYGRIAATPDEAVGVRVYGGTDDLVDGLKTRRVQVRHRGPKDAPDGADKLADKTFAALQGLSRVEGINSAHRLSWAVLGADGSGREERTDNYQIILDNPEA